MPEPTPTAPTPARDDRCFCCGADNPDGLKLRIVYPADGTAETELEIPRRFTGWREMTHGGFVSMVLDELMAHAVVSAGHNAVTAELSVRFLSPVDVGERIRVTAHVEKERGRLFSVSGSMATTTGTEIASATGTFVAARSS